ncbi:MAG TPA: ABC transporter ATP-binding protein [Anaerolineae bacterium]|nr:ABC transporter ATP-binding protein [Anaerolineae bacterium]
MITCENLVKIYKVADLERVALQGLDMEVAAGEMLGIVGPSGSGKSTLLNILGGLDAPSAGRVVVDGQDLLKLSSQALDMYRRREVGFLWQQPSRNLVPYLTLEENVRLPLLMTRTSPRLREKRVSALLKRMEIEAHRRQKPVALSGGQQQRAALAVALANRPRILLADEPTGELDAETARTIYRLLRELNQEENLTILVVTHDPEIASFTSRVVAIHDGKISSERVAHPQETPPHLTDSTTPPTREYVILDNAGRLQIPPHHLRRFRITRRAVLEPTERGILIRPPQEAPDD